ncbi:MAG: leucine-rich repeat protein [Prevotellamassilia sp.]
MPEVVEEVELSTEVTEEEIEEGVKDEYGVTYSKDGLRLLKGNSELTTYTVRKGTRVICDEAFKYCNLESITLPQGVKNIGDDAFHHCDALKSITLPQGVKSIGYYAFSSCDNLKSITLPQGVKSIGNYAFYNCEALTSITLPQGVENIGHNPFAYCNNLSSIICCSPYFKVIDKMLLTSDGKRLISYWGKENIVNVPQKVESIGDDAFSNCKALTSITLPQGVESIGNEAFYYCDALTSIRIPKGTLAHFQRILPSYLHGKFREC